MEFLGYLALPVMSAFGWFYYLLPRWARRALGSGIGLILRTLKMRDQVVRQNLSLAFPQEPETQEKVRRGFYFHLGDLILEIFMLFGPMARFAAKEVVVEGGEHWREAHAQGKGVFFLASHLGNWEVMAAAGALQVGMDAMIVTKHLKPEWLHKAIERGRLKCSYKGAYEPRTLRDVLGHIKTGGAVGIVLDQYSGPPVGIRVPFFGQVVGTPSALAMLSKRTGAPVLPIFTFKQKDGRYRLVIRPPVAWQTADVAGVENELGINTARYSKIIEQEIFAHPEQWLWSHRRFKGDLSPLRENEWLEGRARH